MTDTRLHLSREFESLSSAVALNVGLSLGVWAGRGDWAGCAQAHKDREGHRALAELDARLARLAAFREQLAAEVTGELTTPAAPATIYAVSTGEYSDYRVHGAFVERDDAQALVDRLPAYDTGEVLELPLCAPGDRISLVPRKVYRADVSIKDGLIGEPQLGFTREVIDTEVPVEWAAPTGMFGEVGVWVTAATPDAALKAARDKAADVLAQRHEATP